MQNGLLIATLITMLSVSLLALGNPLMVGLLLFTMSCFYAMLISYMFNSWYGMILFLVYIGGLLVLLMYTTLTTSNYLSALVLSSPFTMLIPIIAVGLSSAWMDWTAALSYWIGESIQPMNMAAIFIWVLGVLLFYVFLMVVFIISTGGKSLQIVQK